MEKFITFCPVRWNTSTMLSHILIRLKNENKSETRFFIEKISFKIKKYEPNVVLRHRMGQMIGCLG